MKGRCCPLSLAQLHVHTTRSPTLHVLALFTVTWDWLDPWDGISSVGGTGGLLGTGGGGRGGGAGGVVTCEGIVSCTAVLAAGRSVGRQGGLRSKRKGIVLLKLQLLDSAVPALTLLVVALENKSH